jgi:drug/metabolite transporter (DMT)-like permease
VANLLFLLAVRSGDLTVVAVITALYPAGTVLLARAVLAERIHRGQLAGLGVAAVAVSLLALA